MGKESREEYILDPKLPKQLGAVKPVKLIPGKYYGFIDNEGFMVIIPETHVMGFGRNNKDGYYCDVFWNKETLKSIGEEDARDETFRFREVRDINIIEIL